MPFYDQIARWLNLSKPAGPLQIFSIYAQMSRVLRDTYQEFFLDNWHKVKRHHSHEDYFKEKMNSCHEVEVLKELFEQYRLLVRREYVEESQLQRFEGLNICGNYRESSIGVWFS